MLPVRDSSQDLINLMFVVQFPSHFESVGRFPCSCHRGCKGVGIGTCTEFLPGEVGNHNPVNILGSDNNGRHLADGILNELFFLSKKYPFYSY